MEKFVRSEKRTVSFKNETEDAVILGVGGKSDCGYDILESEVDCVEFGYSSCVTVMAGETFETVLVKPIYEEVEDEDLFAGMFSDEA